MKRRWRGPFAGLAITLALAGTVAASDAAAGRPATMWLTARGPDEALIARFPMAQGATFVLRYRNSLYGSQAEEHFVVQSGELALVGLAADELAVLEEYYRINEPTRRGASGAERAWSASPALEVRLRELHMAATDLGRRTLLVPGAPAVELWRFVDDRSPTVTLRVEGADR